MALMAFMAVAVEPWQRRIGPIGPVGPGSCRVPRCKALSAGRAARHRGHRGVGWQGAVCTCLTVARRCALEKFEMAVVAEDGF